MIDNMERYVLITLMIVISGLSCHADGEASPEGRPAYWPLTINGYLYDRIELAFTSAEQAKGLSNRDTLAANGGMLFVSDTMVRRTYWMKDCRFDIDIIYMDADGKIVSLHRMKKERPRQRNESEEAYYDRLPTYDSGKPAQFVLELSGGQLDFLGLKVGDTLDIGPRELMELHRRFR